MSNKSTPDDITSCEAITATKEKNTKLTTTVYDPAQDDSNDCVIIYDERDTKLTKKVDDVAQEDNNAKVSLKLAKMSVNLVQPPVETSKKDESGPPENLQPQLNTENVPRSVEQETDVSSTSAPAVNQPTREQRLRNLHPPILDSALFENYEQRSVGELCDLGREVVNDLSMRTFSFSSILKMVHSQRSHSGVEVETLLSYCNNLLEKLVEIKEEVEARLEDEPNHIPDSELLAMLSDKTRVPVDPYKKQLQKQYEENLQKINELCLQMKEADWLQAVLDPRYVEKPETSGIVTKGKQ